MNIKKIKNNTDSKKYMTVCLHLYNGNIFAKKIKRLKILNHGRKRRKNQG